MFALLVRFDVLPAGLDAFDALVTQTLTGIADHEPGTIVYATHLREDRPNERIFYEAYVDHEAFLTHELSPHTRHFLAERGQYLAGDPEVWWLTGHGSTLELRGRVDPE